MKTDLVILAAGMGSRFGGLKQIEPVGPSGERIIDYSIYDARRAGFNRAVFVIRKDMEQAFREAVGHSIEKHIDVAYAFQQMDDLPGTFCPPAGREKPWGTGHAVLAARHVVKNPLAVINADDFYGPSAFRLLHGHLQSAGANTYAMVGYALDRTVSSHGTVARGLCRQDRDGFLIDIEEVTSIAKSGEEIYSTNASGQKIPHAASTPTSMNCWGFSPDLFERLGRAFTEFLSARGQELKAEFYLPMSVGEMVARREVKVKILNSQDPWFGVTYREDKPEVTSGIRAMIDAGQYPDRLWGQKV